LGFFFHSGGDSGAKDSEISLDIGPKIDFCLNQHDSLLQIPLNFSLI